MRTKENNISKYTFVGCAVHTRSGYSAFTTSTSTRVGYLRSRLLLGTPFV